MKATVSVKTPTSVTQVGKGEFPGLKEISDGFQDQITPIAGLISRTRPDLQLVGVEIVLVWESKV